MAAVARVSRKIPTPRPRPTELRENTILFLLSRLNESQDYAADRRRGSTHRWLSAACSSLSDWHHLVGAYGICSEIKLAIPELQLIECELYRPQRAPRAGLRLQPAGRGVAFWGLEIRGRQDGGGALR